MSLRLIEVLLNHHHVRSLRQFLKKYPAFDYKELPLLDHQILVRLILPAEESQTILDFLEEKYAEKGKGRITVLTVETTIPALETDKPPNPPTEQSKKRVARQELYENVKKAVQCSPSYIAMIILSTIVATIGLHDNDIAIIIGAMVIAPLLEPIVALSLGVTLLDLPLLRRAILTILVGVTLIGVLSISAGMLAEHIDPNAPEILARTKLEKGDLAVAIASGCAGALAFTSGVSGALIGVMVAVSLLPPLVTFGLLYGAGYPHLAQNAIFLFLMNFLSIHFASVTVFLLQGVHPKDWIKSKLSIRLIRVTILSLVIFTLISALILVRIHFYP